MPRDGPGGRARASSAVIGIGRDRLYRKGRGRQRGLQASLAFRLGFGDAGMSQGGFPCRNSPSAANSEDGPPLAPR